MLVAGSTVAVDCHRRRDRACCCCGILAATRVRGQHLDEFRILLAQHRAAGHIDGEDMVIERPILQSADRKPLV